MKMSMIDAQKAGSDMLKEVTRICREENLTYFGYFGTMLGAVRHHGPIPWDADVDIYVPEPEMERFAVAMKEKLPPQYWIHYRNEDDHPRTFARIGLAGYKTETLHIDVFRLVGFPSDEAAQKEMMKKGRRLYVMWKAKVVDPDYYYSDRNDKRVKVKALKKLLFWKDAQKLAEKFDELCRQYDYDKAEYVGFPIGSAKYLYKKSDFDEITEVPYEDFKLAIPAKYDVLLTHMYGDYMQLPPEEERNAGINSVLTVRER